MTKQIIITIEDNGSFGAEFNGVGPREAFNALHFLALQMEAVVMTQMNGGDPMLIHPQLGGISSISPNAKRG